MYTRSSIGDPHESSDIKSYVQECGLPSNAVLFWKMADFRFQSKEMKRYCRGQVECRRLSSRLILTVPTIALQVVNAVMFVMLNANVQHLVVIKQLLFHQLVYMHENDEMHEYTNARSAVQNRCAYSMERWVG